MKKLIWIGVAVSAMFVMACGGSKREVNLADLAGIDPVVLEALKDEEHAISTARIELAAAREAETRSKAALKAVETELGAETADRKAAEAELKAAKKNEDSARIEQASALLEQTEADLDADRRLLRWKKQVVDAAGARSKAAAALVELRRAELQAARARLVAQSGSGMEEKYDIAKFEASVQSLRNDYDRARARMQDEQARAENLRRSWRAVATPTDVNRFDTTPQPAATR